jgi:translocation and assembly module TamB
VEIRIQGTAEQPAVLGRIGVLSGEIEFAGKRYSINRGEINFFNPFRFEPVLNLNVQARVQQYDITMDFNGPPDRLNVTYRSDPPLPTRDILALLVAGGSRQTSLQPSSQPLPQVTADALLSQALSSQIGSRLDRIFGNGRVRIDPQLNTFGGTASATIALEQQIKNNVTLLYVTDLSSAEQQYVQGEWTISPKLSVVGIRDQNGLVGVNFQITLRFR